MGIITHLPAVLTLIIHTFIEMSLAGKSVQNCNEAQKRCVSQLGCGVALKNYLVNCGPLIYGETNECSTDCQRTLISLLSIEENVGETFMTCDCGDNDVCIQQKRSLEVCSRPVMEAMRTLYDESTVISCNLASYICMADSPCFTALEFYRKHCRRMFTGEKCTARCNNSLSILYRQPKAQKLRSCHCDGTESYDCLGLRNNTERLCLNSNRRNNQQVNKHLQEHMRTVVPDYKKLVSVQRNSTQHQNVNLPTGVATKTALSYLCTSISIVVMFIFV